ncbi:MAG: DUF2231 domain-containing protein [Bdellovibrionota bacterium]
MKIKEFLQGRFMGHPLHPALVHLPVGLWVASFFFDIASLLNSNPVIGHFFVITSYYCILLGVIAAFPTAVSGVAEFVDIPRGTKPQAIAIAHMTLNVILLAGYIVQLVSRDTNRGSVAIGTFVFNTLEFLILSYSGYLGGKLAYEHRIGSRDHARSDGVNHRKVA